MEPVPWNALFARVKASVPGATDAMIRLETWATMVDFTQDTNAWIEEVPFTTEDNELNYDAYPLNGGFPNRLMLVYDPSVTPPRWVSDGITMNVPGQISFYLQPQSGQNLLARIAKSCSTPAMDSQSPPQPTGYPVIDDWIVQKWNNVLYFGVLSRLQAEPSKVFSNDKQAAAAGIFYKSGKTQAKAEVQRGMVYGGQSWMYPQGWSTIARKGWT